MKPNVVHNLLHLFPNALLDLTAVSDFSTKKHGDCYQVFRMDHGDGEKARKYHIEKVGRHLLAIGTEGEVNAEDGNCFHMAQVVWNGLAYLELMHRRQKRLTKPSEWEESR